VGAVGAADDRPGPGGGLAGAALAVQLDDHVGAQDGVLLVAADPRLQLTAGRGRAGRTPGSRATITGSRAAAAGRPLRRRAAAIARCRTASGHDAEALLTFYDFPAEHWVHLRTSNPMESTFSTVRLRTGVTKGPGSKAAGLAMAFKLLEAAQDRWRAVNGPHLVALVRAGARFDKGVIIKRPDEPVQEVAA
jgi:hypothetical protein